MVGFFEVLLRRTIGLLWIAALLGGGCDGPTPAHRPDGASAPGDEPAPTDELVVYYSFDDAVAEALFRAFTAERGLAVRGMRRSSRHIAKVIEAEADRPVASVIMSGSVPSYEMLRAAGRLEPYRPRGAEAIPAELRSPDGAWTGLYIGVIAFVTDQRQTEAIPRSYDDLLTLELPRGVVYANPASSGTAYSQMLGLIEKRGEEGAFDFLERLHPRVVEVPSGGGMVVRVVEAGEATCGISFAHDILRARRRRPELELSFPAGGTGWEIGAMALLAGAPRPAEGRAFLDFLVLPETQELLWREGGFPAYPTHPDAAPPPEAPPLRSIRRLPIDFVEAGSRWDERALRWNRRFPRSR